MLESKTDRDPRLGRRIKMAIDGSPVTVAQVAAACTAPGETQRGVSTSAVYGWMKTGTISKGNLLTVSKMTKYSLEWLISGEAPSTKTVVNNARTPSAQMVATMFDDLSEDQRRQLWPCLVRLLMMRDGVSFPPDRPAPHGAAKPKPKSSRVK